MEKLPLKDIHLPSPISAWWPPAPGWILLLVILPLLCLAAVYLYKFITRKTALKSANKLLLSIKNQNGQNTLQTLTALSTLLRRVAISTAPRANVASLRGQAWLAYLDSTLPDTPFSHGVGRCLADAPYQKSISAEINLDELFLLCERWLKHQKLTRRSLFTIRKKD